MRQKFKLSHSIFGLTCLFLFEVALMHYVPTLGALWLILASVIGGFGMLYVATEVIEEVRNAQHMLVLLGATLFEFILFFAAQYWLAYIHAPQSFISIPADGSGFLLQSIMVFVFNPLYLPVTMLGRTLLIVNTLCALGLVLFILQNMWQFRDRLKKEGGVKV